MKGYVKTILAHDKEIYKDEISLLVEDAIGKLDKVSVQAKDQKKQIVLDLAKSLEDKIPTDTISMKIVDKLRGRVSERFIRECLDEKYKQKTRVDNARKQQQMRKREHDSTDNLAAVTPLNTVVETDKITILDVDDLMPLSGNDADSNSSATIIDASAAEITIAESPYQIQGKEQQIKKRINSNKETCPICKELYSKNLELEEALEKSSQMITADNMRSLPATEDNDKENNNETLNFEFFMPYGELQRHMASLYQKSSSVEVWFSGKIHKNTRKVISPKLGKLSQ